MTAKPKKELMARLRKERKEAGMVLFSAWVTPELRDKLKRMVEDERPK